MKLKTKRASGIQSATKQCRVRSKGGDRLVVTKASHAARKQKPVDNSFDADVTDSGRAAGEVMVDAKSVNASRKIKRSENGDNPSDGEKRFATRSRIKGRTNAPLTQIAFASDHAAGGDSRGGINLSSATCREIQTLQRRRVEVLRTRIIIDNRLAATVASELGYHAGMEEADPKARRAEAEALIKAIADGGENLNGHSAIAAVVSPLVNATMLSRDAFQQQLSGYEREMLRLVKTLPVYPWAKSVRGFGPLNLAVLIGETGDLSNYANPAKVWKRLGLAPFKGKMPSTWKSKGGLSSEEWTEVGYSPRRRSCMYVLSECLVKLNQGGAYRTKYDTAKAAKIALADDKWPKLRCHRHGMLLAVKELVLDLWLQWHGKTKRATA